MHRKDGASKKLAIQMLVSLNTVQLAVRLIDQLHELAGPADFGPTVLEGISRIFGCDIATYNEISDDGSDCLCDEFCRPIPAEHQLSMTIRVDGHTIIGIALDRAAKEFDEVDRAMLDVLRDPVSNAWARTRTPAQSLTSREREILRLVATGCTNVAISHELGLSPRTVAKHLEHTYRKLAVSNRAAAIAKVI